ncbi:hypothetical protein ACJ41O_007492 [Fusarium nematophilum]
MALFHILLAALAFWANLVDPVNAMPKYTSKPKDNTLPFPLWDFTSTVASVQNTYCGDTHNKPGVKFGDQTLLYSFGNGDTIQRTNIYHSKSLGIIVAYMGTNISSLISIAHDVDVLQVLPRKALGLPLGAMVFKGFQVAWAAGWDDVRRGLSKALRSYPNDKIIVTGHSQGAAIALLGALSIHLEFGDVIKEVIAYGPPRVGNPVFADAFDEVFKGRYTGVANGEDWVPKVLPKSFNYRHPSGMVWISPANTTSWKFYEGQEDPAGPGSEKPKFFYPGTLQFYWGDHQGIYMHSSMGTQQGPCPARVGGY